MDRLFHVCTIANDPGQYTEMIAAFEKAGFSEAVCRFSCFDNARENLYEPYRLLDALIKGTPERYLILCHQDVRPDLGHTAMDLATALARLDSLDDTWAVAGNAGVDLHGRLVLHLNDPHGEFRAVALPRRVTSLDENFLVVRRRSALATSPELSGFHLYGTDLTLQARMRNQGSYVIDFLLTHLSQGDPTSPAFSKARERFGQTWRRHLFVGLIRTSTGLDFALSRSQYLEALLKRGLVRKWLWSLGCSVVPSARPKPAPGEAMVRQAPPHGAGV